MVLVHVMFVQVTLSIHVLDNDVHSLKIALCHLGSTGSDHINRQNVMRIISVIPDIDLALSGLLSDPQRFYLLNTITISYTLAQFPCPAKYVLTATRYYKQHNIRPLRADYFRWPHEQPDNDSRLNSRGSWFPAIIPFDGEGPTPCFTPGCIVVQL